MVTFRILSNIEVHGVFFAVMHERKRLEAKGVSKATARKMALQLVISARRPAVRV